MPAPDAERYDEYLARYLRTGAARIIGVGRDVTGRRKDGSTFSLFLSIGEFRLEGELCFRRSCATSPSASARRTGSGC